MSDASEQPEQLKRDSTTVTDPLDRKITVGPDGEWKRQRDLDKEDIRYQLGRFGDEPTDEEVDAAWEKLQSLKDEEAGNE